MLQVSTVTLVENKVFLSCNDSTLTIKYTIGILRYKTARHAYQSAALQFLML